MIFTNLIFFLFFFLALLLLLCSPFVCYNFPTLLLVVCMSAPFSKMSAFRDVIKTFQDYPMTMSRQAMMTGWTKVLVLDRPPLPLLHLEQPPQFMLPNKVLQKIGNNNDSWEKKSAHLDWGVILIQKVAKIITIANLRNVKYFCTFFIQYSIGYVKNSTNGLGKYVCWYPNLLLLI